MVFVKDFAILENCEKMLCNQQLFKSTFVLCNFMIYTTEQLAPCNWRDFFFGHML